jgi:protoheme IX farnesyltransferase
MTERSPTGVSGVAIDPHRKRDWVTTARDYWTLTKPEVNFLVLMATLTGFYLGSRGTLNLVLLAHTLLGTLLVASGTATLNQYLERGYDRDMRRTAFRPLPSTRLAPSHALWFGIVLSVLGGLYLALAVNPLSSMLAVLTLLSYLILYTPLKRKTPLCTLVGAFPGAMPPLIGWAATRGNLNLEAWILYGILFLWQFPHFLAISWMYREDYTRAGFRMLPRADSRGRFTGLEVLVITVALIGVSLLPTLLGHEGKLYLVGALVSGLIFMLEGSRFAVSRSNALARRLLHSSVIYLPVVFGLMMLDKISG